LFSQEVALSGPKKREARSAERKRCFKEMESRKWNGFARFGNEDREKAYRFEGADCATGGPGRDYRGAATSLRG